MITAIIATHETQRVPYNNWSLIATNACCARTSSPNRRNPAVCISQNLLCLQSRLSNMKTLVPILLFILQLVKVQQVNAAINDVVCGEIYGEPDLHFTCTSTLYELMWHMDRRSHFFSLASVTRRPEGIKANEWKSRVALPVIKTPRTPPSGK